MSRNLREMPVVLVAGWGVPAAMVEPLLADWRGVVQPVSLGDELLPAASIDEVAQRLLKRFPEPAVWLGWSQGGQVAMAAAASRPEQVRGLVTLASFPRFIASADWPFGMSEQTFDEFHEGVRQDPEHHWRRFMRLLVLGDANGVAALKALKPWLRQGAPASGAALLGGLELLRDTDQRPLWQTLGVPALHIRGDRDHVVSSMMDPSEWSAASRSLVVEGMTHWPVWGAADRCRQAINEFLAERSGGQ